MYGDYQKDTINFVAFDHYGTPAFSNYQYVLLFVSEHCGKLYHEKYQYFDVYPTTNGRWARPGDPYKFDQQVSKKINATSLKFKDSLSFDLTDEYDHVIKEAYPSPYFSIKDNRAYPLTGAYAEDLFEIKKAGVLKARGYKFK